MSYFSYSSDPKTPAIPEVIESVRNETRLETARRLMKFWALAELNRLDLQMGVKIYIDQIWREKVLGGGDNLASAQISFNNLPISRQVSLIL